MSESYTAHHSQLTRGAEPGIELDLIRCVVHGDLVAFATLYDQIGGTIYARCLGITGDCSRAEAASRDTLVEMWRTAARFDSHQGSVLAWAFAIADRHLSRQLRSGHFAVRTALRCNET